MKRRKDQTQETDEETSLQKRLERYGDRFEKMSSLKRKEEVKSLLQKFRACRKRIRTLLSEIRKLVENEIVIEGKLKIIGERMRGGKEV